MTSVGTTRRLGGLIGVLWLAPACTPDVPTASPIVGSIAPLATNLVVYPDPLVAESVAVVVKDHRGAPMAGVRVTWSAQGDGAKVQPLGDVTLENGIARALWFPAGALGRQEVYASAGDLPKTTIVAEAKSYPLHGMVGSARRVCGLDRDGIIYCLDRKIGVERKLVRVSGDIRYRAIAGTDTKLCAARLGGGVDCTRWNNSTGRQEPLEPIGASPELVAISTDIDAVAFCGLTVEGQAWCWGNAGGRFGKNVNALASPQPVLGASRFRSIALGDLHGCGVALDRTALCWGYNPQGQLGFPQEPAGSAAHDPAPVPGLGPTEQLVIGGTLSTCALGEDAQVRCWGSRYDGGLGLGYRDGLSTNLPVTSPVLYVGRASGLAALRWGYAAQAGDGKLYTWQISMLEPLRVVSATRFRNLVPSQIEATACGEDFSGGLLCVDMSGLAFYYGFIPLRGYQSWAFPPPTP